MKSIVFSILASFLIFARVRILSRFFAFYRGIRTAKRYKTAVAFWQYLDVFLSGLQYGEETIFEREHSLSLSAIT